MVDKENLCSRDGKNEAKYGEVRKSGINSERKVELMQVVLSAQTV